MPTVRRNKEKWARNSSQAGTSYKEGTDNPRRPWEASAVAAESNYELGVTQGISNKRYSKGISKSGQARYDTAVNEKGISRFTQGVLTPSAKSRYDTGFEPFADAIESVVLPPRGPKGQNIDRVRLIDEALIAEKNKA